jgi:integrase
VIHIQAEDGEGARPYTPEEMGKLLTAAQSDRERRFVLLSLATGPRPGALLQLTWDRVLAETAIDYHLPGRRRTKKRRAKVPQLPTIARYLAAHRSIGPVIQYRGHALAGFRSTFERVAERAGVDGSAYRLRKGLASWPRQQNVPETEIASVLAHRGALSSTSERYAHLRPDFMGATKLAVETLLAEIAPAWLASYLPVDEAGQKEMARIRRYANGLVGSREWDRTTDHLHVKEVLYH